MRNRFLRRVMLAMLLICQLSPCLATEGPDPNDPNRYLNAVREFADNVLKYGRDTYGPKHTPLFVDGLNIHSHEPVKWIDPDGTRWVLSNFASQQTLLRTLDGLTVITGDPKYRQAAMDAIRYEFENLQASNGLLYWGQSTAYDALKDRVHTDGNRHVLKVHYPYYELMWQVNPEATKRFIEAYWSAHIIDWSNLDMDRIASLTEVLEEPWNHEYKGGPVFFKGKGAAFLSTGLSLIHAGITLYKFSNQEQPYTWSVRLARRYIDTRHPKTGISAFLYNNPWNTLGDDMKEHFVDPYTTLFPLSPFDSRYTYYPEDAIEAEHWISMLLVGKMLGEEGREFSQWTLEELTAWGKASYRKKDNSFAPILTDGMVGARGYNKYQGRMYLYWGGPDIDTQPDLVFNGERGSNFGGDTIECGHFNDDAYGDILVGAYSGGSNGEGRIYLYYGAPNVSLDTICDHTFTGEGSMFGGWFNIGNIDGDRYDDLIVSAGLRRPNRDDTVERLYVYYTKPFPTPSEGLQPQFVKEISEDVQPMSFLHKAAAAGDIAEVKRLIDTGANISSLSCDSGSSVRTPLHEAAIAGHKDVAEILLSRGAQPDALDNLRYTPLHCAAEHGHKDMASLLINKGADVNAKTLEDWTPLHLVCQQGKREVAKFLIENGADPKAKDIFMMTPLHFAVDKGFKEICLLLIEKGADIDAKNKNGKSSLDLAISRNRSAIAKLLFEKGAAVSTIHIAAFAGNLEKVRSFIEGGIDVNGNDEDGMTPLHLAAQGGHKAVVEILISQGADLNAKNNRGMTPLHLAEMRDRKEIVQLLVDKGAGVSLYTAARLGELSRVKKLIEDGADVNAEGRWDETPLHGAVAKGHKAVAEFLIAKGADINANKAGYTSLTWAVWNDDLDMIKLLVAHGADVNFKPENDDPAFFYCIWSDHNIELAKLFVAHGASLDKKNNNGWTVLWSSVEDGNQELVEFFVSKGATAPEFHLAACLGDLDRVKSFVKEGVDVDVKDEAGWTPLCWAASTAEEEVAEFLIGKGAAIDARTNNNRTPLHQAATAGAAKLTSLLISKGADSNARDDGNGTPLHSAAAGGHKDVVQLLLKSGADVNAQNNRNRTPLDLAVSERHSEIVELLRKQMLVHDVAVTNVSAPKSCLRGDTVSIVVTLENQGDGSKSSAVKLMDVTDDREVARQSAMIHSKHRVAPEADLTFDGETGTTGLFGQWCCADGDVNGDGFNELLITASRYPSWAVSRGKAYLYYGGGNMNNVVDKTFTGEEIGDILGGNAGLLVDMNNDNFDDVILGAQQHNGKGRVYIFYGGTDMDEEADIIIDPPASDGTDLSFGRGGMEAGDFNGDGIMDLVCSAIQYKTFTGCVYLYYGPLASDTIADKVFTGETIDDAFGAIIGVGDVDGDNCDDLLVATRYYPAFTNVGRAYLYYGASGTSMNTDCDVTFDPPDGGRNEFGSSADVFDIDNDGFAEVLIGARRYPDGKSIGRAYVYWGKANGFDDTVGMTITGEAAYTSLGGDFIQCGYADDDLYGDIIITAYDYNRQQSRAYLYNGNPQGDMDATADCIFTPESGRNGVFRSALADLNNDGHGDVVMAGCYYNNSQGRAWLWYGPFHDSTDITFNWDTTAASPGKHTLQASIAPVAGEQDVMDNSRNVEVEVRERPGSMSKE
ncbi:ankyrin repeat domain-containing protein [Planctomycetota bacterium]